MDWCALSDSNDHVIMVISLSIRVTDKCCGKGTTDRQVEAVAMVIHYCYNHYKIYKSSPNIALSSSCSIFCAAALPRSVYLLFFSFSTLMQLPSVFFFAFFRRFSSVLTHDITQFLIFFIPL